MPELPDVLLYLHALNPRVLGRRVTGVRLVSPFLLRSIDPPLSAIEGRAIVALGRLGKRIVLEAEGELFLVFHLMIAGRFRWKPSGSKIPGKVGLLAIDFDHGTLVMTEAGTKKQASLHVVSGRAALAQHDPGGLDVLDADLPAFREALQRDTHTLKRALTDPHLFSGIGNAYSDEILHAARLSPFKLTNSLTDEEVQRLFDATRATLSEWIAKSAGRSRRRVPREGDRISRRHGGPRPLREALPRLWSAGAARRLCRERGQLLRDVSDRRPSAGRSILVAAAAGRLAAHARGARTPPQRSVEVC